MALTDNLLLYSNMDDATATAVVENTGTYTLTKASTGNPAEGTGKVGDCQDFTADYITTNFNTNSSIGTGDFTWSCWFNVSATSSRRVFMSCSDSGAFNNYFNIDAGNNSGDSSNIRVNMRNGSAGDFLLNCGTTYQDGGWHLLIITRASTTVTVYIDDPTSSVASGTDAEAGLSLGAVYQIGRIVTANALTGSLDEIGIWSRVLTSDERGELWNAGAGTTYPFSTYNPAFARRRIM